MTPSVRRAIAPLAVVLLSLAAACSDAGQDAEATTSVTAGDGTSPEATAGGVAASGPCVNAYLPVAVGNTWTYELSEPAGTVYVDTVTQVGDDGFTISTAVGELTKHTEWACTEDGVTALSYGSGPAASMSVGGLEASFETTKVTGVTLPSELSTGDRWRQTFEISGRIDTGAVRTRATGSVVYTARVGEVETVQVAAGTFEAIAIDTDITLDLTPSTGGVGIPLTLRIDRVQWFAEGIGLVRSESDGDFFGASFSSAAELVSYDVA